MKNLLLPALLTGSEQSFTLVIQLYNLVNQLWFCEIFNCKPFHNQFLVFADQATCNMLNISAKIIRSRISLILQHGYT